MTDDDLATLLHARPPLGDPGRFDWNRRVAGLLRAHARSLLAAAGLAHSLARNPADRAAAERLLADARRLLRWCRDDD